MADKVVYPPTMGLKFREASYDLLTDILVNLNERNRVHLDGLSRCSGSFKNTKLVQYVLLIAELLGLDPLAGYQAIELLQRFMVKHLSDLLTTRTPHGAATDLARHSADAVFDKVKDKFPLIVLSCVQLASKMSQHSREINLNTAVHFLHSVGRSDSKQAVLESELTVLKGLDFSLNSPNPLTYVEMLLDVLGFNEPSIPPEQLHRPCLQVLRYITLNRAAIYNSLLMTTIQSRCPSREQSTISINTDILHKTREKFLTVTEDCMLLGACVITVATFIHHVRMWEQIVKELSHITGISNRSIRDFASVTLMHLLQTGSPLTSNQGTT